MKNRISLLKVLPVISSFFVMGIVDLVGISTNYVKQDFGLRDSIANLLPFSLFLWFAILSVPTSMILNSLGRKRTVIISMMLTLLAMIIPLIVYNFPIMLFAFALLGIGNTIIQVSINPLLTDVVSSDRLTSSLTMGQFIKAIAAFLGPIIASWTAVRFGDWKLVFLIYGLVTIAIGMWLMLTPIKEETPKQKSSSLGKTFALLSDKMILLFFIGILFVVGIDVGLNTTVPKLLIEKCNIPLEKAGLGTSLYFIARTIGTFIGALLLVSFSAKKFFKISMLVAIPALFVMLFLNEVWAILTLIFIVGFAVANVFSIIVSFALKRKPENANEISGLLIMGVAGGAIILPLMGLLADAFNQSVAMALLLLLMGYLLYCSVMVKEENNVQK
ncbi:MFS transporter [Proteiniphilum sp. UBA5480]|jgi:fucose permease|uniref:MFS transporter n=1 Tax=Proteiniphilum sp. UBA5480 TaxID=1947282 RepID=UPI00257A2902|nr:MFS transporter [Proteiniphilum sp. UBA5480]MEA5071838.1 MFS transporter [Petrimonas sp.]